MSELKLKNRVVAGSEVLDDECGVADLSVRLTADCVPWRRLLQWRQALERRADSCHIFTAEAEATVLAAFLAGDRGSIAAPAPKTGGPRKGDDLPGPLGTLVGARRWGSSITGQTARR